MGILIAFIIAIAIATLFKRHIEETIAVAVMLISVVIYLPASFYSLMPGYVAVGVITVLSLGYIIYRTVGNRHRSCVGKAAATVWETLITPGAVAFAFFLLFFGYFALHRDFSHPDELYCFGLMAKEYYMYGTLFSPYATSLSGDATPLLPIWNAFSAHLWDGFSDSICYFSQNMFAISCLLPVYAYIRKKNGIPGYIIVTLMLPLILVVSAMEGFQYVIADLAVAAELIFYIINIIGYVRTKDKADYLGKVFYFSSALLTLVSICLTKRIGVLIASLAMGLTLHIFMHNTKDIRHIIKPAIISFVISLFTFTWFGKSSYVLMPAAVFILVSCIEMTVVFVRNLTDSLRTVGTIALVSCGAAFIFGVLFFLLARDGYGYAVLSRFMHDLFAISFSSETGYGCMILSYGLFMLISVVASVYIRQEYGDDLLPGILIRIPVAMIGYALIMLYLHITRTGPVNEYMESLVPRYMIPWEILVTFVVLFGMIIEYEQTTIYRLILALIVLMIISDTGTFLGQLFSKHQCPGYYAFETAGIVPAYGELIYFIDEDNYFTYTDREFYYRMAPAKTNFIDQIFWGNNGRVEMSAEELRADMLNDRYLNVPYNYLYLQTVDDDFADRYGSLFEADSDILPGHVYYILQDTDGPILRLIDNGI